MSFDAEACDQTRCGPLIVSRPKAPAVNVAGYANALTFQMGFSMLVANRSPIVQFGTVTLLFGPN